MSNSPFWTFLDAMIELDDVTATLLAQEVEYRSGFCKCVDMDKRFCSTCFTSGFGNDKAFVWWTTRRAKIGTVSRRSIGCVFGL